MRDHASRDHAILRYAVAFAMPSTLLNDRSVEEGTGFDSLYPLQTEGRRWTSAFCIIVRF